MTSIRIHSICRREQLKGASSLSGFTPAGQESLGEISRLRRHWLLAKTDYAKVCQAGFTIIEILVAIVVIGVTVPAIMIPFSGLEDTKNPEYIIQGSFVGQKKMEELANRFRNSSTASADIITVCPALPATTTDGDYSIDCESIDVNATDPDSTATSTFAKKVTLTVSRADGQMSPLVFNTLFALND